MGSRQGGFGVNQGRGRDKHRSYLLVKFDTRFQVDDKEMEEMQERAHRYCFVANSLADHVEMNVL